MGDDLDGAELPAGRLHGGSCDGRVVGIDPGQPAGITEVTPCPGGRVLDHRRATHRQRDGNADQRQQQQVLTPLAPEQPPGPSDDRVAPGVAAGPPLAHDAGPRPAVSNDSGPAAGVV